MAVARAPLDSEAVERKLLADIEELEPPERGMRSRSRRARLRAVEAMWIDLRTSAEIVKEITKAFGVDARTVSTDIHKIKEHHWLADELDRKNRSVQLRAQWNDQRRGAIAAGDRKTAAYINDKLCKMDGVYAPDRTENVNINITVNVAIDDVLDAFSGADLDQFLELVRKFELRSQSKVIDVASVEVREAKELTSATETDTNRDDES